LIDELARITAAQIDRQCDDKDAEAASTDHCRAAEAASILDICALPLISPTHRSCPLTSFYEAILAPFGVGD